MVYLTYLNKALRLLDSYNIKKSSREVSFSEVIADFTGKFKEDLPVKFQEVEVWRGTDTNIKQEKLFTGYIDTCDLPELKNKKEYRELTISLLSPLQMATNRTFTMSGSYDVQNVIERTLQPLLADGFVLKNYYYENKNISVSYLFETVENVMNDLSNRLNLWWYIDENKNIYIYSLDYLFGLNPVKTIKDTAEENGLLSIKPQIKSLDYANVINIKNARVFYSNHWWRTHYLPDPIMDTVTLKKGDTIRFNNPVSISENIAERILNEMMDNSSSNEIFVIDLSLAVQNTYIKYTWTENTGLELEKSSNVSIDDENLETDFVFERDTFFKDLLVGFKYNGDTEIELVTNANIPDVISDTALKYTSLRCFDREEIEKQKGVISASGQIEKTIDAKEKWFMINELIDYAKNQIAINGNETNIVNLIYDINPNLEIGNLVDIQLPDFLTVERFIVTDMEETYEDVTKWNISLRNSSCISNYIDLFRESQTQSGDTAIGDVILNSYVEEKIDEKYTIVKGE